MSCHLIRLLKIENGVQGSRVLKVTENKSNRKRKLEKRPLLLKIFSERSFAFKNN